MAEREELTIRTAGGAVFLDGITLTEYTLTLNRMGMPSLTASVRYKECLDDAWTGDEYVDCMGERYWLRETPTSMKDSTDERYDHELNFVSEREKLAQTYFYDVVTDTGVDYKPITNSTEFKFWGTLKEFVGRLNSALQYAGIGDTICQSVRVPIVGNDTPVGDGFVAMVDESGDYELDECKELTFENEYIWNAISKAFDTYGVPFAVRGRRIIFGETPIMADCKLEYGADNELLKITKTNQNNLVVRETTGLGSSENIPYYYPNDTEYGTIGVAATEGNAVLTTGMVNVNRVGKLIAKVAEGERLTYRYVTFVESEAMPIGDAGKVWTLTDGYGNATNCKQGGGQGITNVATVPSIQQMGVGMQPECQMRFQFLVRGVSKPKFTLWMRRYKSAQSGTPTDSTAKNMAAQAWAYNAQIIGNGLEAPIGAVKRNNRFEAEDALAPGLYTFTCRLNAYDEETSFSLTSIEIESDGADSSYWECNGQIFRQIGMLGLGINGELGADANGDSIEWTSRDRMTFQTRLVVPKYRNTRGTERFYKALNRVTGEYANAYRAENGVPYVFPNPYREGNPSQHIYEDDSIKPTIEGIRNDEIDPETGLGKLFGEIAAIAYDENDNDSLKSGDEDRDNAEYEHSFFYIKLRRMNYVRNGVDYSLDLFNMASQTDAMTIQMTSGRCAGCKFKIQAAVITRDGLEVWQNPVQASESGEIYPGDQAEKINKRNIQAWQQDTSAREVWVAVQKDTETFGVLMPNRTNQYFPSEGDTFNIININLPKCYILDAERRLEKAMMKNMRENNDEKWEFDVEISRVWLAEHKNVLDTLDEYCTIPIVYDGKEYVRYVTALTIESKDKDALPELKLTLAGEIDRNDDFVQKTVAQAVSIVNGLIPKKAPSTKPFVTENITSTSSVTVSSETPQSILDKLKRVDGPQSELDADTLDGHHAAEFATKDDIPDTSGFLTDSAAKQLFLSKLSDDVAQGRITFQQGLDSLGLGIFADGATFGDFISGLVGGRGAAIDALGNAEVESLKVRSSLEVIELLINRLAAIEGDQLLTEADTIESVVDLGSNCYRLQLKSKWDGYFTAITAGSVMKGIYNTLALSQTPGSDTPDAYFTSWMRVNSVNQAANSIEVSLYPDNQVPSGTNHLPVELMNIARWGHQTDTSRQSCLYLSSTEGKIVKLKGVTAPIISESNIALSLGTIPSFVYSYLFGQGKPVTEKDDMLYADSIAVRNLYYYPKGDGTCEIEYVDRGRWQSGGSYYYRAPGTLANGKWEVSDVWHYGCKWRCMANLTTQEPKWNSTDWAMIEGNPNFTVEIDVPEGFYDPDDFHAEFNASARLYNRDISLDCLPGTSTPAVTWEWRRRSYDSAGNERVASDTAWASAFASSARGGKPHIEIDDADLSIDSLTGRPKKIVFIAIATLPDGSVQTQEIEIA